MPDSTQEEFQYLWRTHGGLYARSGGRIGKLCSLRTSPYGSDVDTPEPASIYASVDTRFGQRFRAIGGDDVVPGTKLHISFQNAGWVTTSRILDAYRGSVVDTLLSGVPHIIYTRDRAWLLPTGDSEHAVPLLAKGWEGRSSRMVLPQLERPTVLRLDTLRMGARAGFDWIDAHAPAWRPRLEALAHVIAANEPGVTISDARFDSDGLLRLRLSGVLTQPSGAASEFLERAVLQETAYLKRTCTVCGDAAEPTLVVGADDAYEVRSLCRSHAQHREVSSEMAIAAETASLSRRFIGQGFEVEPGWYPLLIELDEQLGELSEYSVSSCAQHFGELVFRTDFPDFTDGPVQRRVRELVRAAEHRAETTCEHCGADGERRELPWIHVCCGSCSESHAHVSQFA